MLGVHKSMGDKTKPDLVVSIDVMLTLMKRFERDWCTASGDHEAEREDICPLLFCITSYLAGLLGKSNAHGPVGNAAALDSGVDAPAQPSCGGGAFGAVQRSDGRKI